MLVVVAVLGLLIAATVSPFTHWSNRYRFETFMDQSASLATLGRSTAIRAVGRVVLEVDADALRVWAFLDRHGPGGPGTAPDGVFTPVDGLGEGSTDWLLGQVPIPAGIEPGAPQGQGTTDGLTLLAGRRVASIELDGSVTDPGAFRFGDRWGNYLELRLGPAATARTQIRKYHKHWPKGADGSHWYSHDQGPAWEWSWGVATQGGHGPP